MEIHAERPAPDVLAAWGFQAACLLYVGDWDGLAQRFGYALAWDETPQAAIRRDTAAGLAELGAGLLLPPDKHAVQVHYFHPNDAGLVAETESGIPTDGTGVLVLTCVVWRQGAICRSVLEHIWAQAGDARQM